MRISLDLTAAEKERERFFNMLMRRPMTEREALKALAERGLGEDERAALVAEAINMQLLNDADYAKLFAEGHDEWGNDRIEFELSRRGVNSGDIEEALSGIDEAARARELTESWRSSGLEDRKIIGRLHRRGFSSSSVRAACRGKDYIPW